MSEPILNIKQLNARVEEKEILHDINLQIHKGETHVLMGPNGAGKSTLGYVLMGNPKYQVTGGSILFKGKDVTEECISTAISPVWSWQPMPVWCRRTIRKPSWRCPTSWSIPPTTARPGPRAGGCLTRRRRKAPVPQRRSRDA